MSEGSALRVRKATASILSSQRGKDWPHWHHREASQRVSNTAGGGTSREVGRSKESGQRELPGL